MKKPSQSGLGESQLQLIKVIVVIVCFSMAGAVAWYYLDKASQCPIAGVVAEPEAAIARADELRALQQQARELNQRLRNLRSEVGSIRSKREAEPGVKQIEAELQQIRTRIRDLRGVSPIGRPGWRNDTTAETVDRGAMPVPVDRPSVAVLATRHDPLLSAMSAVIEATLSESDRLHMVDREALHLTLSEQQLQLALGDASQLLARDESWNVVGADVLLVLDRMTDHGQAVRLGIVHTGLGLRTTLLTMDDQEDPLTAAGRLSDQVIHHLFHAEHPVQIVCVPPVIDNRLIPSEDRLAEQMRERLELRLSEAKLVMLEVDEARYLQQEMTIRGANRLQLLSSPWMLQARIYADPLTPGKMTLTSVLRQNQLSVLSFSEPLTEWQVAADRLASESVAAVHAGKASGISGYNAAQLIDAANSARATGQYYDAIDLIETLLLFEPEHKQAHRLVLDLYDEAITRVLKGEQKLGETRKLDMVAGLLQRGLDHAEAGINRIIPHKRSNSGMAMSAMDIEIIAPVLRFNRLQHDIAYYVADRSYGLPSKLPEEFRHRLAPIYQGYQTRLVKRMLDALDRGVPPLWLKQVTRTIDARNDYQFDEILMRLRLDLWARVYPYTLPGVGGVGRITDVPPMPKDADMRLALIELIDEWVSELEDRPQLLMAVEGYRRKLDDFRFRQLDVPQEGWPSAHERMAALDSADTDPGSDAAVHKLSESNDSKIELPTWIAAKLDLPAIPRKPSYGVLRDEWVGVARCGDWGDLLWRRDSIYLLKPSRTVTLLYAPSAGMLPEWKVDDVPLLSEPVFDGDHHVWVIYSLKDPLLVSIDLKSSSIQIYRRADGLLPADAGASLAVLRPGRLVLTGSFGAGAEVRSWSLLAEVEQSSLQLTTLHESQSAFAVETGGSLAGTIGRSRVYTDPIHPDRQVVAVEHNHAVLVIDPERATALRYTPVHGISFGRALHTSDRIVKSTASGPAHMFVPATGAYQLANTFVPEIAYAQYGDWSLGIRAGKVLAAPKPYWSLRHVATLKPDTSSSIMEEITTRAYEAYLCASPHHGLIIVASEGAVVVSIPAEMDRLYHRAPIPVSVLGDYGGTIWYLGGHPLRDGWSIDTAWIVAEEWQTRLPSDTDQIAAFASQINNTLYRYFWTGFTASRRGRLDPGNLIPPGAPQPGRFPVVYRRGGYEAVAPDALAPLALPMGSQTAKDAPNIAPSAFLGPQVVAIPSGTAYLDCRFNDSLSSGKRAEAFAMPAGLMISTTEVTRGQYRHVMQPKRYAETDEDVRRRMAWMPVTVRFWEAQAYCSKLSEMTGQIWRLPTQQEWEYAARAGSTTAYANGDTVDDLRRIGWCRYDGDLRSTEGVRPVRSLEPNAWGLYDMHGNVEEWVATVWDSKHCVDLADLNVNAKHEPLACGGSATDAPDRVRSASHRPGPERAGFRVILDLRSPHGNESR